MVGKLGALTTRVASDEGIAYASASQLTPEVGRHTCVSMSDRYEPDEWTVEGEKITEPERLAKIREAADRGGIVVRHWHYRGAQCPDIRGFTDFEEFETYLRERAKPGDAFDVWSVSEICDFERALAGGKLPDADGCVPKRGAY